MPYCVQCGQPVGSSDRFCAKCGAQQPGAPSGASSGPGGASYGTAGRVKDFWSNISHRNAALLCYIPWVGWIAAIAVLASDRFRSEKRLRFHAFQGLYLFAAWLMVEWVIAPMLTFPVSNVGFPFSRTISQILHLVIVGAWIFMLMKVSHDEDYRLPILGELADRSVSEQRP
ncbi:MAG: hypothetical protein JWO19_547 [Bryobacterales bacterium]|jgi:uncharacterized membrane protein|nr:hypothetical protein [Bryobacterales bacterium]